STDRVRTSSTKVPIPAIAVTALPPTRKATPRLIRAALYGSPPVIRPPSALGCPEADSALVGTERLSRAKSRAVVAPPPRDQAEIQRRQDLLAGHGDRCIREEKHRGQHDGRYLQRTAE